MIVRRVASVFRAEGLGGVLRAVVRRIRMPHAASFAAARDLVAGRAGIEIGGPSPLFAPGGLLPVYSHLARLDNCNFASDTLWEARLAEGGGFVFHAGKPAGRQYIAEGTTLTAPAGCYDVVLSSHMLEHTANPLRALLTWRGLLGDGGALLLVVPHRDGTFDHRRPVTTLAHLEEDLAADRGENDLTHLDEVLRLHDVSRDPGVSDAASFRARAADNARVRSLHHHVFDTRLAVAAVRRAGFEVVSAEPLEPYHIVVLAVNGAPRAPHAALAEGALRDALRRSPFATDRAASDA